MILAWVSPFKKTLELHPVLTGTALWEKKSLLSDKTKSYWKADIARQCLLLNGLQGKENNPLMCLS